jgi:hypothetical protein
MFSLTFFGSPPDVLSEFFMARVKYHDPHPCCVEKHEEVIAVIWIFRLGLQLVKILFVKCYHDSAHLRLRGTY